jgi:capsular polysaccharide biosynthesis protein
VELRYYWSVIWRRIWIIALIVGVVVIYAGYQYYKIHKPDGGLRVYHSDITIRVGLQATSGNANGATFSNYASTAEALADQFASDEVLKSNKFDAQVIQQIQADLQQDPQRYGANADLGNWQDVTTLGGALSTARSHNLVDITVSWGTAAGAKAIATAIGEVAVAHISEYLDYQVRSGPAQGDNGAYPVASAQIFSPASAPVAAPGPGANREVLLLALILVGLIVGIALAFLIEYLDDRIRSTEEAVKLLQLPAYGEVPRAPAPGQSKTAVHG